MKLALVAILLVVWSSVHTFGTYGSLAIAYGVVLAVVTGLVIQIARVVRRDGITCVYSRAG